MNVLWIMTDEQRADSLGCYDSPWAISPNVDRISRSGVSFHNAYTPAPLCVPARTTMLSGLRSESHGVWSNADLAKAMPVNLVDRFADAGYATASFGKSHYASYQSRPLFQTEHDRWYSDEVQPEAYAASYDEGDWGVVHYPSPYTKWLLAGHFPADPARTSEWQVTDEAVSWLSEHARSRPEQEFFLRVSYNAPHTPVVPPQSFAELIDPMLISLPEPSRDREQWPRWYRDSLYEYARSDRLDAHELARIRHHYYAQCAFVDSHIGRILDALDGLGLGETTAVAFCSDHGTHLGDYGLVQKQTFFEPSARVPFIISLPGAVGGHGPSDRGVGRRILQPVSIASLLPTLLSLCGLDADCDFESLADVVVTGREPSEQAVVSECTLGSIATWGLDCPDRLRMVRRDRWKLCYSLDTADDGLLFDLEEDPLESRNLFHDPDYTSRVAELSQAGDYHRPRKEVP